MYKNQLQELAQRSCFNLPAYACIREGPDHAPRFKATVNFNGEIFESPIFCSTLRQAEHAAAEVALNVLSKKGPSKALAARVLDETGVYKNLLQETVHRAGLKLPVYTTVRSGPSHVPVFSCTVELAGMSFTGETAKTKKQAQKNAAMTAWSALKKFSKSGASPASSSSPFSESGTNDVDEQVTVAHYLASLQLPMSSLRFRHHRHKSAPIQRDVSRYDGIGNRSLFPLQHRNGAHSRIHPEASMYQAWIEEKAYHNQNRPFSLSSLSTYPHRPHIIPFIHSVFQSDPRPHFLAEVPDSISLVPGISPVLYFSTDPVPAPIKSVSQLTIREIEEKSQEGLKEGGEKKSDKSMPNAICSNELESSQIKQHWVPSGFTDARLRPQATSTDKANLSLQNLSASDYLHSNSRPQNILVASSTTSIRGCLPASFAAPPMVRTAATSCPVTPRPENSIPRMPTPPPRRISAATCCRRPFLEEIKNAGVRPSASFVAPTVHIRSVVPVCSAPPAKKPPNLFQERLFNGIEKNKVESKEDVSAQSLDFSKLHM
ncbi:hypothetical protein PTKIN_Ptkin10aG0022600 [Pterospermum kingtungense]